MGRSRFPLPAAWLCHVGGLALSIAACDAGTIGDSLGSGPWGSAAGSSGLRPNGTGGSGNSDIGKPSGSSGSAAADGGCKGTACGTETPVASSAFSRLSHRQWAATVRDLLYMDAVPDVAAFTSDAPTSTAFDNNGGVFVVSSGLESDYETAVEKHTSDLVANAARVAKLMPANAPTDIDALGLTFVATFGERAFRRPLTAAESESYVMLWKRGSELFPGVDPKLAGVRIVVQAMLLSPMFEYRIELGKGKLANGSIDLTDYEIATRLSFMFWDSAPDAVLLAAAKAGELHDPAKIAAQAKRLLADPRAATKVEEFHRQLLELRRYDGLHPTGLPEGIGAAMRTETERFVHDVIIDQNGSLETLLTASYSFVNKDLAALYGVTGTFGTEFTRAELNPTQRAGLLTQAGFLTYRSGDTAPILRGVFVNEKFLCAELPPPPVFTPPKLTGNTRRERVNSVTGEGTCGASCHATLINPAGYPLEYFDDTGKFRTQDNGRPVDGTASYPFRDGALSYDGPIEWSRTVQDSAEAHECYVKHWLEFGLGRPVADGDAPLIARVATASRDQGISVKDLLVQLVQSPNFRSRAGVQP
jgi:hypothetical protein